MASKYLIPTPTESISIGGHSGYGKLLFSANSSIYAFKPADSTADWWAIGAVYHYRSAYYIPCIVSDTEEYASSLNDNSWGESQQAVVYPVEYNGKTYYASYAMAGASGGIPANSTIPVENEYTYNSDQITDAAKTLLDLYIADGGSLPGEEQVAYNTAWIKKQTDQGQEKAFAFAHAKTVYTDYGNKKTLADYLADIFDRLGKLETGSNT